ncbi:MAG: hypothetical protein KAY24_07280 [Candidatus Eisenbacteria sp.]|nr:hypothetical protein [Candidatus Eisenbacteria bacterium]
MKVVSLPFVGTEGFDTEPLDSFCRDHDVTAWRDHFFICDGRPDLAVILEYRPREAWRKPECRDARMAGEERAARLESSWNERSAQRPRRRRRRTTARLAEVAA